MSTSVPGAGVHSRPGRLVGALLAAIVAASALSAPATAGSTAGSTAAGSIEDLGPAMYSPNVRLAATDVLADGTPVAYAFSDGRPVSFNVIDIRSGSMLDTIDLPPYTVASSIVIGGDDTVYFSVRAPNDGSLWRYRPQTKELTKLATGLVDEQMLRTLIIDGQTIYGSTYPNAKVYSYDTVSGQVRDYGSLVTDGDYAWGLALVDGKLWVGTGAIPHLKSLDPATGAVTELPLPADAQGADFVNGIVRHGDLVFVKYSPAGTRNVGVYDVTTGQWCCADTIGASVGLWTKRSLDGRFYYIEGGTLYAYDVAARQRIAIGWAEGPLAGEIGGTTAIELVELGTPDFPGSTVVGVRDNGTLWRYNLTNRTGDVVSSAIKGSPATIQSIGHGPDGNVYFGAYLSAGVMARVNRKTGRVEQLSGPTQGDSIIAHKDKIVVGTYPDAGFYAGTLTDPWQWGTNPSHLFTLGRGEPYEQDRPLAMVSAGRVVAAGTIPNYGELGGALVLFDPTGADFEVHRNVVAEQSITALAYDEGLVFGGTSINGGLSSTPTQTTAELFIWDLRAGQKSWSAPVIPGATIIHALAIAPSGLLWGMADNGVLFEFDVRTRTVVRSMQTGIKNDNVWGRLSELYFRKADGYLYGNAGGKLFRVNPKTFAFEVLVTSGARQSGVDRDGALYFANETNIFRYRP